MHCDVSAPSRLEKKNVEVQLEMNERTLGSRFSSCPDDSMTFD